MPYVVVIGAAGLDILGFPHRPLIQRESNPGRILMEVGGVGRNIAENLARMGVSVELISAIGDDPAGRYIREHCSAAGVGLSHSLTIPGSVTPKYIAISDIAGDMKLAISDMAAVDEITPAMLENTRALVDGAAALVVDGNLSQAALEFAASEFQGIPLCADPVSAAKAVKIAPILDSLHILKVNAMEAEAITGLPVHDEKSMALAGRSLIRSGVRRVFLTMGSTGVYWNNGDTDGFYSLQPKNPVNTTGAGDAYMAGIVYGTMRNLSIGRTLEIAAAAASVTLESPSAVNPEIGGVAAV